jgi:hypothetical protein
MFEFFRLWLCRRIRHGRRQRAGSADSRRRSSRGRPSSVEPSGRAARRGDAHQSWAYSVTFATMAGWSTCLAVIIITPSSREAWVWWSIAASIAVWFPLDTGRSLLHRVYANVAVNTALLVILAIPLIGTFGEFH